MKTSRMMWLWLGAAALSGAAFLIVLHELRSPVSLDQTQSSALPFVPSMAGTKPDGDLKPDLAQNDVSNRALRRFFDYYLNAIGEQSSDAIRAEIVRDLHQKLQPIEAYRAQQLLSRYVAYRRDLTSVGNASSGGASQAALARERLTSMQQMRKRFFSEQEITDMFSFEDAYDMDAVARLEISEDKNLTSAQKQEKLAQLDQVLPPSLREAREAPLQAIRLDETATKMRSQGASEDDIYRMRAAAINPEAAARLAAVDQEQNAWRQRIADYLAQRQALTNQSNLSEATLSAAIQQLRDAKFSHDEQLRLEAYEQGA